MSLKQVTAVAAAILLLGILVGSLAPAGAVAQDAAPVRIGYVDLQRALNAVEDGRQAREQLEADFERRQQEIDQAQTELQQWAQEVENGFAMLTEEARMERMQEYQTRLQALQEMFAAHQRELATAEQDATEEIFERMLQIVEAVAEERGYTFVLEKTESSILYAADGLDFTDELIQRYDAAY